MLVRRLWIDGAGDTHAEDVTLIPGYPGVALPDGPVETEGLVLSGPGRVVAVVDPACGVDGLGAGAANVWTAPLLAGARIVDRAEWDAATGGGS